ncbi:MAG: HD family hydrolase [Pseudomonadota bacterium]
MLSGRRLNILDPSPLDIEITDIAHGLARVARWNGQTAGEHSYSVAQHSLLVEAITDRLAPPQGPADRLAALLHDAPEYVVGDLISPFKAAIGEAYKGVEARLTAAIHLRFSIPADPSGTRGARIKAADAVAAYHEAVALAGFSRREADTIFGPPRLDVTDLDDLLTPWSTALAQVRFMERFEVLDRLCTQSLDEHSKA